MIMRTITKKSFKLLNKLTTKRLLAYYKAERKRMMIFLSDHTCDCGCGEIDWDLNTDMYKQEKKHADEWDVYLGVIKSVLEKREHVK